MGILEFSGPRLALYRRSFDHIIPLTSHRLGLQVSQARSIFIALNPVHLALLGDSRRLWLKPTLTSQSLVSIASGRSESTEPRDGSHSMRHSRQSESPRPCRRIAAQSTAYRPDESPHSTGSAIACRFVVPSAVLALWDRLPRSRGFATRQPKSAGPSQPNQRRRTALAALDCSMRCPAGVQSFDRPWLASTCGAGVVGDLTRAHVTGGEQADRCPRQPERRQE